MTTVPRSRTEIEQLEQDCAELESRLLTRRIASGRYVFDLMRGESDETALIQCLTRHIADLEGRCRDLRETLVASIEGLHCLAVQLGRQRDTSARLREELRAERLRPAA
jgi:hypothetical protein